MRSGLVKSDMRAGFTLIEVIIVLAVMAVVMAPLGAVIYQSIRIPQQSSDALTLLHSVRQATSAIADDARQAAAFAPGTQPDYGTFSWADRTGSTVSTYSVRYYYSSADARLMRQETVDATSQTTVVSDNIEAYGDVSLQQTGDLIVASVTATTDSLGGTLNRTASIESQMRQTSLAVAPTPPPYTVAWDDFESGGWSGGFGWLDDWYHAGDSSIVSSNSPYQGTYQLQLRGSTGYVNRSLDLSGQSHIRAQFWAKANAFNTGDTATFQVSSDGVTWNTVKTWVSTDADDVYRFYNLDLSPYAMTSEFWIAFQANMTNTSNYFWVDDLEIVRSW